jgi:hypothetical protein
MGKPIRPVAEAPGKTKTAAQILDDMRDRRHDPDKALALLKAAHAAGGRPVDFDHAEAVRNGFVEVHDPNEVRIKRNGKIGYRTKGVVKGPLHNLSFMERRLIEKERDFLKQISKFTKLDNAMTHFVAKQGKASAIAVKMRCQRSEDVRQIVLEAYKTCRLPRHLRVGYIARKLAASGRRLSERRIRQIISSNIAVRVRKSGNDGD